MRRTLRFLTYNSALMGFLALWRPMDRSLTIFLWPFKLFAGALAPLQGMLGVLGAVAGLLRRDWTLVAAGALGAGFATKFVRDIPSSKPGFEAAFGPDWQSRVSESHHVSRSDRGPSLPARRWSPPGARASSARWERDAVYGQSSANGQPLRADLWEPQPGTERTGLGLIYIHGGAWRIGDKDMLTRAFFRRLAGQGHVVLDIAYTLSPDADLPTMIGEVKQAILWMKENAPAHGVDPERVVVMGGSAGAHLALMAAYTPNDPAFQPPSPAGNTAVRGVVAFYPPTDFAVLRDEAGTQLRREEVDSSASRVHRQANAFYRRILGLHGEMLGTGPDESQFQDWFATLMGCDACEVADAYWTLSPRGHVGPHCPPTLLLQGSDDVFGLAPTVRLLQQDLESAGVPSVLVEFPHTEHAFDLVLPRVSPLAQAATTDVERFLALLV